MTELMNWGNYPRVDANLGAFSESQQAVAFLNQQGAYIPRGLGRCYGDAALYSSVLSTVEFKDLVDFNPQTGLLNGQSGLSLAQILKIIIPHGWFLPVTPGTRFVTIGGAIAADVHGKDHRTAGSFCRHVVSMNIQLSSGEVVTCSPTENAPLFHATAGGMGLTGLILSASIQMKRIETAYMVRKIKRFDSLAPLMEAMEGDATHSVAWMDGMAFGSSPGQSVLMQGEHARLEDLPPKLVRKPLKLPRTGAVFNLPFFMPNFTLNNLSIRAFNALQFFKAPAEWKRDIINYDKFFYPLDRVYNWNRFYGRRGFTQYQLVIPLDRSEQGLKAVFKTIAELNTPPYLSVLKRFGKQEGILSFPMEGYTLAVDFPIRPSTFEVLEQLDQVVTGFGGRIYLAKDCRMSREVFFGSYPNILEFRKIKDQYDPNHQFRSCLSDRLGLTEEEIHELD